jgi:hypothetical protein
VRTDGVWVCGCGWVGGTGNRTREGSTGPFDRPLFPITYAQLRAGVHRRPIYEEENELQRRRALVDAVLSEVAQFQAPPRTALPRPTRDRERERDLGTDTQRETYTYTTGYIHVSGLCICVFVGYAAVGRAG